jgi:hypothetical protein
MAPGMHVDDKSRRLLIGLSFITAVTLSALMITTVYRNATSHRVDEAAVVTTHDTIVDAGDAFAAPLRLPQPQRTVDVPRLLPAHHKHPGDPLTVMFVGDSITEGMAPNHGRASRPLVPKEGSCSFRFPLMRILAQRGLLMQPVGPFAGHVGAQTSHLECQAQLKGAYIAGVSERHAAVWGVTATELLSPASLSRKRRFARRYYFGGRRQSPQSAATPLDTTLAYDSVGRHQATLSRSHLSRWSDVLQPGLSVVLLGTNDLASGSQVEDVVLGLLPTVARDLLFPRGDLMRRKEGVSAISSGMVCPSQHRVAVSTLLPRALPLQRMVADVNWWMDRIQRCKTEHAQDVNLCGQCVATEAMPTEVYGSTLNREGHVVLEDGIRKRPLKPPVAPRSPQNVADVWCLPCIHILNISLDPNRIDHSYQYMYDGLHPNRAGEERIGELIADALLRSGALG